MVTCSYCQVTQRVAKPETIHSTPTDWRAPAQWTPPAHVPARSINLGFNPRAAQRKTRGFGCGLTVFILLTTLLPIALSFSPSLTPMFHSWRWDGAETFVCSGNDRLEISGKKLKAKASPVIVAKENCRLLIEDSKISGKRLLQISGNAQVTIKGSKLTAKDSPGATVETNGKLEVDNSTLTVHGAGSSLVMGVKASTNAEVRFRDGKLVIDGAKRDGKVVVVQSGVNGDISFEDSHVTISTKSPPKEIYLFDMGWNAQGSFVGGSIDAGKQPLLTLSRKPVEVRDADLKGSSVRDMGKGTPGMR
jgi:hypothetical protein